MELVILFTVAFFSISIMIGIVAYKLTGIADQNPSQTPPPAGLLNHGSRPLLITAAGFLLGVVSRLIRPRFHGDIHYEILGALALLLGVLLFLLYQHQKRGSKLAFQLENLALWLSFSAGWTLIHGSLWEDFLALIALWFMGSWAVGGLFLCWKTRRPNPTHGVSLTPKEA